MTATEKVDVTAHRMQCFVFKPVKGKGKKFMKTRSQEREGDLSQRLLVKMRLQNGVIRNQGGRAGVGVCFPDVQSVNHIWIQRLEKLTSLFPRLSEAQNEFPKARKWGDVCGISVRGG